MSASGTETGGTLLTLSNSLADAAEEVGRAVVAVNARGHVASSGLQTAEGVIVTADHTVERDEGITVTLPDGGTVPATLAGRDPGTDLAVLRIEGAAQLPVAPAAQAPARVGQIVLALARPGESGLSASLGMISATGGEWRTWSGGRIDQLVRPDLTLYPGFSGGPLVDAQARIVGINTSGLSRAMSLTIPTSTVDRVVKQLLTSGRISRGYLGVGLQPVHLPDGLKDSLQLAENAALIIVSVENQGPAEKAGMLVGDILVTLDGKSVGDTKDVQTVLDPEKVGKNVTTRVIRAGSITELQLTVGERPRKGQ